MMEDEFIYYARKFAYFPTKMKDGSWCWLSIYYLKYTVMMLSPVQIFYHLMISEDGVQRIAEIKHIKISKEDFFIDKICGISEGPESYRPLDQYDEYLYRDKR